MTQNKVIGITGNSGSGKTTVCAILAEHGGDVINADAVTHRLMEQGTAVYKKIVSAFGTGILDENKIDRKKLGTIVFNDEKKRTQLENIIHPAVVDEILSSIKNSRAPFTALDVVLLIESGLNKHCDAVWLVTAPEDMRLSRIISRDSLSEEAADARMRNQRNVPPEAADRLIINDGNIENLEKQVADALGEVLNVR